MSRDEALQIICETFAHVNVEQIVVEYDTLARGEVAKIYVRADQLEAALGENGSNARRAAMESGIDVEVVLSEE